MNIICVIPARYGSTRFPGKPLADILGKPLIQWVYEKARASQLLRGVLVATDDLRIYDAVESFGGNCVLTTGHYHSGTDRIADAVHGLEFDAVLNLQGDEPLMDVRTIDLVVRAFMDDEEREVATAMVAICDREEFLSPNVVKVVVDSRGHALYFSRSPIPCHARVAAPESGQTIVYGFKHLGLYCYRKDVLIRFPQLQPTKLEQLEQLEQLRFLEHGFRIKVVETPYDSKGVDTPEDLVWVKGRLEGETAR
jgi:3-deoxy-manno-octulosonate cytidylyltransferase (CMP-KDO synthetase)